MCFPLTNCITNDTEGWLNALRGVYLSSSLGSTFHQRGYNDIQMLAVPFHALFHFPPTLSRSSSACSCSRKGKAHCLD